MRAVGKNIDALRLHGASACAQMQVLAQAVEGKGGLDDGAQLRVLQVQYQGIVGHDVDQYRDGSRQVVVSPQD